LTFKWWSYFIYQRCSVKESNHKIIGAIGVSGGSVAQDHEVAIAGANALQ
jgi:uncharacterized protein GlcG (DUF336 family)